MFSLNNSFYSLYLLHVLQFQNIAITVQMEIYWYNFHLKVYTDWHKTCQNLDHCNIRLVTSQCYFCQGMKNNTCIAVLSVAYSTLTVVAMLAQGIQSAIVPNLLYIGIICTKCYIWTTSNHTYTKCYCFIYDK